MEKNWAKTDIQQIDRPMKLGQNKTNGQNGQKTILIG